MANARNTRGPNAPIFHLLALGIVLGPPGFALGQQGFALGSPGFLDTKMLVSASIGGLEQRVGRRGPRCGGI